MMISLSLKIYLEVGLLGHTIDLLLVSILLSMMATQSSILISSTQGSSFLHIYANVCYLLCF